MDYNTNRRTFEERLERVNDSEPHLTHEEMAMSVEGTLKDPKDREIIAHFAGCEGCREERDSIRQSIEDLKRYDERILAENRENRTIRGRIERLKQFMKKL